MNTTSANNREPIACEDTSTKRSRSEQDAYDVVFAAMRKVRHLRMSTAVERLRELRRKEGMRS